MEEVAVVWLTGKGKGVKGVAAVVRRMKKKVREGENAWWTVVVEGHPAFPPGGARGRPPVTE